MSSRSVGIVLTGGRSSRMGTDKASLVVAGKPLAVRVANALSQAGCHPVECQGGDPAVLAGLGLVAFEDRAPGGGPLEAIVTALHRHPDQPVLIAACDLVDLDAVTVAVVDGAHSQLGDVADAGDVSVARAGGRRHLLARFEPGIVESLEVALTGGVRSFVGALDLLRATDIEVDEAHLRNVNTPGDLDGRGSLDSV